MQVGDLFVSLGVKGSDKTVSAITTIKTGLKDTAGMALETKAAIVGAAYALEGFFAKAGQKGNDLVGASMRMQIPLDTLQRFQYVAATTGSSAEALSATFEKLQNSLQSRLAQPQQTWGAGLHRFMNAEKINAQEFIALLKSPDKLFLMIQDYAQKQKDVRYQLPDLKEILGGAPPDILNTLLQNQYTPKALSAAPVHSDKTISAMARSQHAWAKVGQDVQMMFDRVDAKYGSKTAAELDSLIPHIERMISAFMKLGDAVHIFKAIDMIVVGWGKIFDSVADAVKSVQDFKLPSGSDLQTSRDQTAAKDLGEKPMTDPVKDLLFSVLRYFSEIIKVEPGKSTGGPKIDIELGKPGEATLRSIIDRLPSTSSSVAPSPKPVQHSKSTSQNIHVNNTLNFAHEGRDHRQTADSLSRAVVDTWQQLSSKAQVS